MPDIPRWSPILSACSLARCLDRLGGSTEVGAVLTDNGREFCGRSAQHPLELLLAVKGIEHRTTKVRSPRTNGFVERMNRTLLDGCFRVKVRTTRYVAPEEIQRDLDVFIAFYNVQRTHQGYRLKGRTPAQALREALGIMGLPDHRGRGLDYSSPARKILPPLLPEMVRRGSPGTEPGLLLN